MTTMEAYPAAKPWYERTSEEGIIDFVAKLSPWIAPLPSAWFVHDAVVRHMNSGNGLAWIIAVVIETLGLTTTHTALGMHAWNMKHKGQPENQAPFTLSVVLACAYVAATLSLILVLEVEPTWQRYAPAMFPILAGMGAVNLALRYHHGNRVNAEKQLIADAVQRQRQLEDEDRDDKREERRLKNAAKYGLIVNPAVNQIVNLPVNPVVNFDSVTPVKSKIDTRRAIILDAFEKDKNVKIVTLMKLVGASRNTVKEDMRALGLAEEHA